MSSRRSEIEPCHPAGAKRVSGPTLLAPELTPGAVTVDPDTRLLPRLLRDDKRHDLTSTKPGQLRRRHGPMVGLDAAHVVHRLGVPPPFNPGRHAHDVLPVPVLEA